MEFDEAVGHALDGNAVLFVGAGFSCDAENTKDEKLPTGSQLEELLSRELSLGRTPLLDILSDMFIAKKSELRLTRLLRSRLIASKISDAQAAFGTVRWNRVYTTNYDNVVEMSYAANKRSIEPLTLSASPTSISPSKDYSLHINGYIEKTTESQLGDDFVLTNTAYLSDRFNKSRWSRLFREDIEAARAVIFVGYSLYDIDIGRVLQATDEIKKKCCFVVEQNPPEELVFSLDRFGSVAAIGTAAAGERLSEISSTHVATDPAPVFRSFRRRRFPAIPAATITDDAVFQLYALGKLDLDLLPGAFA